MSWPPRVTRRRSRGVLAALFFSLAVGLPAFTGAAPSAAGGCSGVSTVQGWQRIAEPIFAAGAQDLVGYAVSAGARDLYATNGTEVDRSGDGGCSWQPVYTLSATSQAAPLPVGSAGSIGSVVTGPGQQVYLVVRAVPAPQVLVSRDSGATWAAADTGIAALSTTPAPAQLVVTADGAMLYLLVSGAKVGGSSADMLYSSSDGGAAWTAVPLPVAEATSGSEPRVASQLVADPGNDQGLWLATSGGLFESANAGLTWTDQLSSAVTSVALAEPPSGSSPTMVALSGQTGWLSRNRGANWVGLNLPTDLTQAAAAAGQPTNFFATSASGGFYSLGTDTGTVAELWAPPPALSDPTAVPGVQVLGSSTALYGCSCQAGAASAIWRGTPTGSALLPAATGSAVPSLDTNCLSAASPPPASPSWGNPALTPGTRWASLAVGGSAVVPLTLYLPPRELDVYFLPDMGYLSEFSYCPIKYSELWVAAQLDQSHDLWAGLGEFGDYPPWPGNAATANTVLYERSLAISPVGPTFAAAVQSQPDYWEDGGSPNGDKGNLAALYQSATGAGQTGFLPAGQAAGFNPQAVKVVVMISSENFNTPSRTTGYPGPTFAQTIATLRAQGVVVLGVWVDNVNNKWCTSSCPVDGYPDLETVARGTGAVAQAPVDCTGDGSSLIPTGGALVCPWIAPAQGDYYSGDTTIGREVVAMLNSMRDPATVQLSVLAGGLPGMVLSPAVVPAQNLLLAHSLPASLKLSCPTSLAGRSRRVEIGARLDGVVVATATIELQCAGPRPYLPLQVARRLIVAVPPIFLPNPPVPPNIEAAPRPYYNPGSNTAQAPQAQTQPMAQGVPVAQHEQQPQAAFAFAAKQAQQLALENQMVGLPDPARSPPLLMATSAVAFLMSCAAGIYAYARRTNVVAARSTNRRRGRNEVPFGNRRNQ